MKNKQQTLSLELQTSIKELREELSTITYEMGNIGLQILSLKKIKKEIKEKFYSLEKREKDLIDKITKEHGKGRISLDTGEFHPLD